MCARTCALCEGALSAVVPRSAVRVARGAVEGPVVVAADAAVLVHDALVVHVVPVVLVVAVVAVDDAVEVLVMAMKMVVVVVVVAAFVATFATESEEEGNPGAGRRCC